MSTKIDDGKFAPIVVSIIVCAFLIFASTVVISANDKRKNKRDNQAKCLIYCFENKLENCRAVCELP